MFSSLERHSLLLVAVLAFVAWLPGASAESQWVEVKSPHFSVVTDAGEKHGREVAVRFEQMRSVFGALMVKANVNLPIPLQIVAFRNSKEFRQVEPLWHGKPVQGAGLFQPGQDRSFIMLDMSVENPWTVVFHEYAHQLMNGNVAGQIDPWFDEGFAEYFSSIEVDGKQAKVGKIPAIDYQILVQQGRMKIADLLQVQHNSATYNENGDHRTVFYAESSMLVHYLFDNNLVSKLATYFTLKVDKGLSVEDAFQQTFGMSTSQFDKVFYSYAFSGAYKYFVLPTPADIIEKGYSVRTLGPHEADTVIADIHLHSLDYRDKAVTEFQDILNQDSNNAAACRGLGYAYLEKRDFPKAQEYFQRAGKANSNDPRVHYYSALLMNMDWSEHSDPEEMTRELETAIALDPTFADAYMLLGYASGRAGDMPKALANMQKAVALSPRNENYRFNLAQTYLSNRHPDEGIAILEILSKSSDPMIATRAQQSLTQARQFKAMMQAAATGTLLQPRASADNVSDSALADSVQARQAVGPEEKVITLPPQGVIKFLKGAIQSVDCSSSPAATLIVQAVRKTWTLKVADTKNAIVLGADTFSCNWKNQKVAINYRETGDAAGTVVSIEVQ
jgi:tetratricopeptide (TPR) repeat protein